MKCVNAMCSKEGDYRAMIVLHAPGRPECKVHVGMDLVCCEDHALTARLHQIIHDETWRKIIAGMKAVGAATNREYAMPRREDAAFFFVHKSDPRFSLWDPNILGGG